MAFLSLLPTAFATAPTLISFGTQEISDIISQAADLLSGLMPLLVVILGISVGAFIIRVILHVKD